MKRPSGLKYKKNLGFTILELVVAMSIIGVLAAIVFISYTGVSQRAIESTIKSDLSSALGEMNLFKTEKNKYPTSIDNCPNTDSNAICLKLSGDNDYQYTFDNNSNPKKYFLIVSNGDVAYFIDNNSTRPTSFNSDYLITAIGSITGTPKEGETLTAGSITPSDATVTYQWQRADSLDGSYVNIAGATSLTYMPSSSDVDKYIKVIATGIGSYIGSVTSSSVGAIQSSFTIPLVTVTLDGIGSWTAPSDVTSVTAYAWGAGGSGSSNCFNQGGGGGGAFATKVISVTPNSSYNYSVGTAGWGRAGYDSWFVDSSTLLAKGGGYASPSPNGGVGGQASASIPAVGAYSGGNGSVANTTLDDEYGGGGGGGAGSGGNGSNGIYGSPGTGGAGGIGTYPGGVGGTGSGGSSGVTPGGGGGGADDFVDGCSSGTIGGNGRIILTYYSNQTPPTPITVTGGLVTYDGVYTIRTFKSSGTLSITGGTITGASVLIVGGGASGTAANTSTGLGGNGGRGGQVVSLSNQSLTGNISVTVGSSNQNSSFGVTSAIGGGGSTGGIPKACTIDGIDGVNGTQSSISGASIYYGGGGGAGGARSCGQYDYVGNSSPGAGSLGFGATWFDNGCYQWDEQAQSGGVNNGGGGGGGGFGLTDNVLSPGAGGTGVVIVRYLAPS